MESTTLLIPFGGRSTLVDIGGLPGVPMLRLKFNMPGCGCEYNFKAYLYEPFDEAEEELVKTDVKDFLKLFLFGDKYSVNYCSHCGKKLPKKEY